ncbi:hypothetical protein K504DRAFT_468674 [Pleomassaria siparia CBS 279.74]|uniref:Uncharacterized protein n=1 Tax=Pleomassaria siparia CBS 279.74 TaxID=1314801 RepID=A0A6G1K624_9PLEO|nr:hypothetical protein K504DRAFT_468674 [Pleomassaria siparia CBS 279.74]
MPSTIRINATVSEARVSAGHSKEQWDRFYFITKEEAKQLSEVHTDWTRWILIPANEKDTMLERINSRLIAEGIPAVEMIILKWRMSQLLRDIQRKFVEGSMTKDFTKQDPEQRESSLLLSQSPHPSDLSPIEPRPVKYDPIRDEYV